MHPSPTRAQVYQVDDPCLDIGGGAPPPIGIKVKDPTCGVSRAIQVVSFQHLEMSIKNKDSRLNHLPQCKPFHQ
jgi:hypothetical protein